MSDPLTADDPPSPIIAKIPPTPVPLQQSAGKPQRLSAPDVPEKASAGGGSPNASPRASPSNPTSPMDSLRRASLASIARSSSLPGLFTVFDARNATTSVKADRADIDRVLRRTGVLWLLLLHPALAMLPPMSLKELVNLHLTPIVVSLRARYADLKDTLTADPGRSGADPLSSSVSEGDQHGSEGPSWDRYFLDTQLKTTINQDVTRTFQDMPFFREAATQKTLDQVLFVWSRQHGEVGYRQGMHEVAAVVLWVLHNDRLVSPATDEVFSDELEKNAWQALESNTSADIEADCHTIFSLIMKLLLLPFYMHKAPASFGDNKATPVVTPQTSPNRKPTPLLSTSARIFHNLLQPTDPQLYQTLVTCGVEEQVWGVRWLRLLFSREIPPDGVDEDADDGRRTQSILKKVVEMWTAIFAASGLGDGAEEVGRQVLEWTAVEMLVAVRDKVLANPRDPTAALQTILRYSPPAPLDAIHPARFVLRALLRIPAIFPPAPISRPPSPQKNLPQPPQEAGSPTSGTNEASPIPVSAQAAALSTLLAESSTQVTNRLASAVQGFMRSARASPIKGLWNGITSPVTATATGNGDDPGAPSMPSANLQANSDPLSSPKSPALKPTREVDTALIGAAIETALHLLKERPLTESNADEAVSVLDNVLKKIREESGSEGWEEIGGNGSDA